ncbi:MAG: hypothetical protein JNJ59_05090 [Deltaproteobacteria bacterium]|nr:hypothetical protein [Deltaproteobacteria bacterium]
MQGYDTLVSALEICFDFHSARVIAREAVSAAGLADGAEWNEDDLHRVAQRLPLPVAELGPVCERLGVALPATAEATSN